MTAPDLQRWSREVAEDPGSPAFVPLARAYRKQGRRPAALNLVLRGLERNPENVEAHAVLALLHVDVGERESAGDEWQTILRLDPENFDAHRGLGFLALERGQLHDAQRHLEAAAAARPSDPSVRQALEVLHRRQAAPRLDGKPAETAGAAAARASAERNGQARDPARLFDDLAVETPYIGAMLLDARGLLLAGSIPGDGRGEILGAMLDAAVDEARRATRLLGLGTWTGMFLQCEEAALHIAPVEGEAVVLLAARGDAPAGWVMRTAGRAGEVARRFLEARQ